MEITIEVLQRISCAWLALSIIYPEVNRSIMRSAQNNDPLRRYRAAEPAATPRNLMPLAFATLSLTIIDILLSLL